MQSPGTNQRDANCFDFLRLFAAACVLVSHSAEHLNLWFFWVKPGRAHSYWFYDGVPLFFTLSGFLVYRSYLRCMEKRLPVWHYLLNRFLRVAPAIYVYTILTTVVLLIAGVVSPAALGSGQFLKWVAGNLVLMPIASPDLFKSFGTGFINGSLWTIPAEVGFYLIIPIICLCERRLGFWSVMGLIAVIGATGQFAQAWLASMTPLPLAAKLLKWSFIPYLAFFGLGVFWSRMWERVWKGAGLALICALAYVLIRTLNVFHPEGSDASLSQAGMQNPLYYLAWSLCLSYVVLWFGHHGPTLLSRITRRVGDLSYGVYIWHMVVVNLVLFLDLPRKFVWFPAGTQICVVVLTFALAYLSWRLIEKPALRFKPYTSRLGSKEGPLSDNRSGGLVEVSPVPGSTVAA